MLCFFSNGYEIEISKTPFDSDTILFIQFKEEPKKTFTRGELSIITAYKLNRILKKAVKNRKIQDEVAFLDEVRLATKSNDYSKGQITLAKKV